jgi:GIY-YIG catalytic domain
LRGLLEPEHLYVRDEVLQRSCPVPAEPGVYAWYFRTLPDSRIESAGLHHANGLPLLYVGISPKRPPADGSPPSGQSVRARIRYHYRGHAEGSTLRRTLGCLLAPRLGIELRRVGSGSRMTFSTGEPILSEWMAENALVCWSVTPTPWEAEEDLIARLDLPLNLDQNSRNSFHSRLVEARAHARQRARTLPILPA